MLNAKTNKKVDNENVKSSEFFAQFCFQMLIDHLKYLKARFWWFMFPRNTQFISEIDCNLC